MTATVPEKGTIGTSSTGFSKKGFIESPASKTNSLVLTEKAWNRQTSFF
jgi:hypothetical protein